MSSLISFAKGIGFGAAALYFFDPVVGARRRSLLRDQFVSGIHDIGDFCDRGMRDLKNRAHGVISDVGARCTERTVDDHRLCERVRATMGKYVSHPRALDIDVHDGCVTVRGTVLSEEVPGLLGAIRAVRGVHGVENQLDIHDQPDVPSLQGGRRFNFEDAGTNWSPATRLLAAGAGVGLILNGALRQRPVDVFFGLLGIGMFWQSISHQTLRSRAGRRQTGGGGNRGQRMGGSFNEAGQWDEGFELSRSRQGSFQGSRFGEEDFQASKGRRQDSDRSPPGKEDFEGPITKPESSGDYPEKEISSSGLNQGSPP